MKKVFALITTVLVGATAPAAVADHHKTPCDGTMVIMRVSDIVEGGSLAGIERASADHQAWYRANGSEDNRQIVATVLTRDAATDTVSVDESRAVTLHINPPNPAQFEGQRGDDAWEAFVAKYRENSKVAETFWLCLPEGVVN
jgi:hypothetical protein